MLKFFNKNFIINIIIVTSIFFLDRISKIYVISQFEKNFSPELFTSKYLNITLIWNEGIAFGLLSFDKSYFYNFLTMIIMIIIIVIFFMILKSSGFRKYSLLIILGGALGNVYDRIFFKAVPDFIDFHVEEFHWFIFNVSDIFITIGVIFVILIEIIETKKNEKN
jgi:signal peptidase II|tara:strand:- start:40 stop:534 length:495 start_codon:yes stop_codon:yes gene_type:complete